jgi:hypothetical protein
MGLLEDQVSETLCSVQYTNPVTLTAIYQGWNPLVLVTAYSGYIYTDKRERHEWP